MSRRRSAPPRGFTLVELLVVLGIIALLVALLMPAVMYAVNVARRTRMSTEIAALQDAIEKYKTKVGDYPPNFRDYDAFIRHCRTRYPKINVASLNLMIQAAWGPAYNVGNPPPVGTIPIVDEGESLVLWLSLTRNDPIYPFNTTGSAAFQVYYEFDQRRLADVDGDTFPSYQAAYAKDTFYLYLDSRSYQELSSDLTDPATGAYAEITPTDDLVVRPYVNDLAAAGVVPPVIPLQAAFINATSFQILCAGQDGLWGNTDTTGNVATGYKGFPGGQNYFPADRDNITNFSNGRMLEDNIPD